MRAIRAVAVLWAVVCAWTSAPRVCHAWNPNTHNFSAERARTDAVDDGSVTIAGRSYPLRPEVVAALRDWPQFFHAGVVGPDGFPDVTYGQTVIHPVKTGEWMRRIHGKAWEAQLDPSYSDAEKSQILAFAYGYLTHASGDMWAHTLVNDISDPNRIQGVFPGIGDILSSTDKAEIALRHLITERYMADATPGIDVNPERGPAPGGDVSDDSSPAQPFDAPHRFIYETLVDPDAPTPVLAVRDEYRGARGPLIGFFLELRDDLQDFVDYDPDPLQDAIDAYDDTIEDLMALECSCNFGSNEAEGCSNSCCPFDICNDVCDGIHDAVACPLACIDLGFTFVGDTFEAFLDLIWGATQELALLVVDAYVGAWIDDINAGVRDWSQLGLAFTRGLADPQTRRNLQNEECQFEGPEGSILRGECEDGIGTLKVIRHEMDPFVNDHLLSMIGLPDFVGQVREIVNDVLDVIDDILGYIGLPFNPIQEAVAQLEAWVDELIMDLIAHVLGIDLEQLAEFVKSPHRFMCIQEVGIQLPVLGDVTLDMFPVETLPRLDGYMRLPVDAHIPIPPLPDACGRLGDDVAFDPDQFEPFKNSTTMAKLLLLDGPQLNQMLTDLLDRTIATYAPGDNVMVQSLDGTTWLKMIDGDHAWRADGQPVFPTSRSEDLTAGTGQFPIWESCVTRDAFRAVMTDWENGAENFPDLDDPVSADPANDPSPPTSALAHAGASYDDGVHKFVAADNVFTHTAEDGPPGQAFPFEKINLQHRFFLDPGPAGDFVTTAQSATFSLSGADGLYHVEIRSEDCCHTFAEGDGLDPEPTQAHDYVLDATPPVTTCGTPPFGQVFDTDDLSAVSYSVSDGPLGSGVASESATLDGYLTEAGVTPIANGGTLDMYLLYPGIRTVAVASADNLGNAGVGNCTFEIYPTAASMLSNLERAWDEGLIRNAGLYGSLQSKLQAADRAGARGQCETELNVLGAFALEMDAQRGIGVDAVLADRMAAFARYLIEHGDPRCESTQRTTSEEVR